MRKKRVAMHGYSFFCLKLYLNLQQNYVINRQIYLKGQNNMETIAVNEELTEQNQTNRLKKFWQKISFGKKKQMQEQDANVDSANETGWSSVIISHMTPEELLTTSLKELMSNYLPNAYTEKEKKQNQDIVSKFQKYFGKDFDVEKTKFEFTDPKAAQVAQDYLNEKLEGIKNKALSMNIMELNKAVDEIYKFIGFTDINLLETPKQNADLMFQHRVGHFAQMANTFTVLDTVRDILDISTDATMLLGAKLRLENDIKQMENLHRQNAISGEQMAIIYENIGRIHDHYFAKDKGYNADAIGLEKRIARQYMEDALNLTCDVDRIQSCQQYLQQEGKKLTPKIARMVQTAYERYFAKMKANNEPISSKAHEKYADAIVAQESCIGFIDEKGMQRIHNQTDKAISHYIKAIETSPRDENKVQVLNKMLHYVQKYRYDEQDEYLWKSVNVVNDTFSGKNKVLSLMQLLPKIKKNLPLKKILLESTFNELLETTDMDEKSRNLLLKNAGKQWVDLADAQKDIKGIAFINQTLDKIEKADKIRLQKEQMPISRKSSGGKDYFA